MANDRQHDDYDIDSLYDGFDLDDAETELSFEKKSTKRYQKARARKIARRRVEDYFERKALKESNWDFDDELYN